ncbi:MAG: hypothetical protein RQ753_04190 [Desulfurivibrionaceae bacterium]|nr:hypothetical protein [Desulfobulbales bacterium]MDT8334875.1 hypothetical protein [Desulfurivibrionaceae bacterium]
MNATGKKIILLGAVFCLLLPAAGCRGRAPLPPHPYFLGPGEPPYGRPHVRAGYRYRYYPGSEVYYDTSRNLYFYISGGVWLSAPVLPGSVWIDRDNFVTMEVNDPRPYFYHRDTLKRYPPGLVREKQREQAGEPRERPDTGRDRKVERSGPGEDRVKQRPAKNGPGENLREGRGKDRSEGPAAKGKRPLARKSKKTKKQQEEEARQEEEEAEKEKPRPRAIWR